MNNFFAKNLSFGSICMITFCARDRLSKKRFSADFFSLNFLTFDMIGRILDEFL